MPVVTEYTFQFFYQLPLFIYVMKVLRAGDCEDNLQLAGIQM